MNFVKLIGILFVLAGLVTSQAGAADMFITDKSEVYPYGNAMLQKPYTLVLDGAAVRLNEIAILPTPSNPERDRPATVASDSPRDDVYRGFRELQRELEQGGFSPDVMTHMLVDYVASYSAVVDSVTDVGETWFTVWWNDATYPEDKRGKPHPVRFVVPCTENTERVAPEVLARQVFDAFKSYLERDCIIILTSGGNFYVPPNDPERLRTVREEITEASSMTGYSEREFAAAWNGRTIPANIAWEFTAPIPLRLTTKE